MVRNNKNIILEVKTKLRNMFRLCYTLNLWIKFQTFIWIETLLKWYKRIYLHTCQIQGPAWQTFLVNFSKTITRTIKLFSHNKIWPRTVLILKFQTNRTKIKHFTIHGPDSISNLVLFNGGKCSCWRSDTWCLIWCDTAALNNSMPS